VEVCRRRIQSFSDTNSQYTRPEKMQDIIVELVSIRRLFAMHRVIFRKCKQMQTVQYSVVSEKAILLAKAQSSDSGQTFGNQPRLSTDAGSRTAEKTIRMTKHQAIYRNTAHRRRSDAEKLFVNSCGSVIAQQTLNFWLVVPGWLETWGSSYACHAETMIFPEGDHVQRPASIEYRDL
jgi:hypothetical protein